MNIHDYIRNDGTTDFRKALLEYAIEKEAAWTLNPEMYATEPKGSKVLNSILGDQKLTHMLWQMGYTYTESVQMMMSKVTDMLDMWGSIHEEPEGEA